jgi:hypothetical protein
MSCSLRSLLVLLAVLAATANAQAARKSSHRAATRHTHKATRHTSHTKPTRYRRPAVHRRPVQGVRHRVTRIVRRPVKRTVVRTVRRYPVHRVYRYAVRRPYYFGRHARHHRRYTYIYYPGRYNWRTNYYNRVAGIRRRHASRGIRGIVEGVQGNAGNGTVLLKVLRQRSSRFRYGTTNAGAGRGAASVRRFHVNNGTRFEILTAPPKAGTFAALHKGEHVLILTHGQQANTAQKIEVFPRRKR